ncbi:hypothetical protein [Streptomyces sp. NPDC001296]
MAVPACRPGARPAFVAEILADAVTDVTLMKGIERGTWLRPGRIITDVTGVGAERVVVLSGPNLARELTRTGSGRAPVAGERVAEAHDEGRGHPSPPYAGRLLRCMSVATSSTRTPGCGAFSGMAAPAPSRTTDPYMAMTISAINDRLPPSRVDEPAPLLLEAAREITAFIR